MRINPQDKVINKEHPMENGCCQAFEDMLPLSAFEAKEQFLDGWL
jgi:asparagine synthase (glutamine-hydrolysing)